MEKLHNGLQTWDHGAEDWDGFTRWLQEEHDMGRTQLASEDEERKFVAFDPKAAVKGKGWTEIHDEYGEKQYEVDNVDVCGYTSVGRQLEWSRKYFLPLPDSMTEPTLTPEQRHELIEICLDCDEENLRDDYGLRVDILMNGTKGYNDMSDAELAESTHCCPLCGQPLDDSNETCTTDGCPNQGKVVVC